MIGININYPVIEKFVVQLNEVNALAVTTVLFDY